MHDICDVSLSFVHNNNAGVNKPVYFQCINLFISLSISPVKEDRYKPTEAVCYNRLMITTGLHYVQIDVWEGIEIGMQNRTSTLDKSVKLDKKLSYFSYRIEVLTF